MSETDSLAAIHNSLTERQRTLLESECTKCSTASTKETAIDEASATKESVSAFDAHFQRSAQFQPCKLDDKFVSGLPQTPEPFQFSKPACLFMGVCDDDLDHENSEPMPSLDNALAVPPSLRRIITEVQTSSEDLQLKRQLSGSAHSAEQLDMCFEDAASKQEELCMKHSKVYAHARCTCNAEHPCVTSKIQKRLTFAQKHLFKSGFKSESLKDFEDTEEEMSCQEADLTSQENNTYPQATVGNTSLDGEQA